MGDASHRVRRSRLCRPSGGPAFAPRAENVTCRAPGVVAFGGAAEEADVTAVWAAMCEAAEGRV
jgi:hypothetical protein